MNKDHRAISRRSHSGRRNAHLPPAQSLDLREQAGTLQIRIAELEQAAAHRPARLSSGESWPAITTVASTESTSVARADSSEKSAASEEAERQYHRLNDPAIMASEIALNRRYIEARYRISPGCSSCRQRLRIACSNPYAREDLKSWYVANEERRNGR